MSQQDTQALNQSSSLEQQGSNPWETGASPPSASDSWETEAQPPHAADAWDSASPDAIEANPWQEQAAEPAAVTDDSSSWLETGDAGAADPVQSFSLLDPFQDALIPLDAWVNSALAFVVEHARPAFQAVRIPIDTTLTSIEAALLAIPQLLVLLMLGLFAWQVSSFRLALGTVLSFTLIGLIGAWPEAMVTLSLVLTSVAFCVIIGLPLGIAIARSDRMEKWVRPLLDAMQTTPAFVYLVPVVMLFGIGNVPGVVVTIVFALPPLVRLTNLGIRQVRPDLIEASRSFGASPWQLLCKVQLPLALPTIMAGVNQTLMLSLSMVVIASMIAVGGLGQMVLRGIGRLDMGLATIGGLGIVLMAIVLDRMSQSMGRARATGERRFRHWTERGPAGLIRAWMHKPEQQAAVRPAESEASA